ncbi:MAG TPA: sodium:solute symporter [Chitinophagaceae bacterium]|nr:sodium:solute symporter [Chitinophagaceae bacterium]
MSATLLFSFVIGYFALLLIVAWITSRNSNNDSFFIGNRKSNWMLVAFGMIGTSLSGVTFVSVPGTVGGSGFGYFQVVIGYLIGYMVIAYVLLPLYYKMNLTSIYNYLQHRFGMVSYKTGALFFIISRVLGATARLFLVINVMQLFILDKMGVSFEVATFIILLMILLYTIEGGVKTIVFTDTLQTTFMLLGLIVCMVYILQNSGYTFGEAFAEMGKRDYTRVFNMDPNSSSFWVKHILGGAFIAIGMTGLDQEMMQKNISVKTLKDSQKNIITFSAIMAIVNFLFLVLGGLLYLYASTNNIKVSPDDLFPTVALQYMPTAVSIIFIIGLISALFPSADGALTALTSSFCIDMLGLKRREDWDEKKRRRIRITVHLIFAAIFFLMVMVFKWIDNKSIIDVILRIAGYTYGPLLGLFGFGILTKRSINDKASLIVCLLAPVLIFGLDYMSRSTTYFGNFKIGYELLIYNGLLTFLGLWVISAPSASSAVKK